MSSLWAWTVLSILGAGKNEVDWEPLGRKHCLLQEAQSRMWIETTKLVSERPSGRSVLDASGVLSCQCNDFWSLSIPDTSEGTGSAHIRNPR